MFTHWLATIGLGPILLIQGEYVRRTIPMLPEPPGERRGSSGEGPDLRVLVVGDSAAAGVGADHQDQALLGQVVQALSKTFRVTWRLLAKTGATTASTMKALEKLDGEGYDVAVTSLGVNDITAGVGLDSWLGQQRAFRQMLRQQTGVKLIVAAGLPPVSGFPALPQPLRWYLGRRATQFDQALAADLADEEGSVFLNLRFSQDPSLMATDGFHPGPGVYRQWGLNVADAVRRQMVVQT